MQFDFFNVRQFGMFSDIQILKGLGMELNEIKDYLLHRSPANYAGLLERQISRIRKPGVEPAIWSVAAFATGPLGL